MILGIINDLYGPVDPNVFLFGGIEKKSLNNMSSSIGMMTCPIYANIKNVPNHQPDVLWVSNFDTSTPDVFVEFLFCS